MGGHMYASCWGLRFFLCSTLVTCWLFHFYIISNVRKLLKNIRFFLITNKKTEVYMALNGYTWPFLYISWYSLITLLKVPTAKLTEVVPLPPPCVPVFTATCRLIYPYREMVFLKISIYSCASPCSCLALFFLGILYNAGRLSLKTTSFALQQLLIWSFGRMANLGKRQRHISFPFQRGTTVAMILTFTWWKVI